MKNYKTAIHAVSWALVALVLLFVDLATKMVAEARAFAQQKYVLGLVRLWYVKNTGIAFGMFSDNAVGMTLITALTIVLIIGIGVLAFTVFKKNGAARITLAVIEAGAVGNLVDRLVLGYVRDFVDISPVGFGICNIADFFITIGAAVLVFIILFIGPSALFPLKKEWREEAKRREEESKKHGAA